MQHTRYVVAARRNILEGCGGSEERATETNSPQRPRRRYTIAFLGRAYIDRNSFQSTIIIINTTTATLPFAFLQVYLGHLILVYNRSCFYLLDDSIRS